VVSAPVGQPLEKGEQHRVTVEAVAGGAHDLPVRPIERQGLSAGDAAAGVAAVNVNGHRRWLAFAAEHFLGGQMRIAGIGQRRRRSRVQRAAVLCPRGRQREPSEEAEGERATQHGEVLMRAACRANESKASHPGRLCGA